MSSRISAVYRWDGAGTLGGPARAEPGAGSAGRSAPSAAGPAWRECGPGRSCRPPGSAPLGRADQLGPGHRPSGAPARLRLPCDVPQLARAWRLTCSASYQHEEFGTYSAGVKARRVIHQNLDAVAQVCCQQGLGQSTRSARRMQSGVPDLVGKEASQIGDTGGVSSSTPPRR
jgi:hypothetical protein